MADERSPVGATAEAAIESNELANAKVIKAGLFDDVPARRLTSHVDPRQTFNGKDAMRTSLFERSRIVGLRFSAKEFERLEAANAERKKKLPTWDTHGHRGSISHLIRTALKPIIDPPAVKSQVVVKQQRSKKKAGKKK